jgi:hypothetical protein
MLKLWSFVLFFFVFFCNSVLAQYNSVLKSNLYQPFYRPVYGLSFEHAVNQKLSFLVSVEGGRYQISWQGGIRGAGVVGEGRYYPLTRHKAPRGLFLSVACRFVRLKGVEYRQSPILKIEGGAMGAGIAVGYKYVYKRFAFEVMMGSGVGTAWGRGSAYLNNPDLWDFYVNSFKNEAKYNRVELSIGYAFNAFIKNE